MRVISSMYKFVHFRFVIVRSRPDLETDVDGNCHVIWENI